MINIAVEGESDREVAKAVVRAAGHAVNHVRVAGGKSKLDRLLPKYNTASAQQPWVVFRDSDRECPVTLRARLAEAVRPWHPTFTLRIAHTMSEAWLLADREAFAAYFQVSIARVPRDPEVLQNAKRAVIELCGRSSSRAIRQDMVAGDNGIGPLYVMRVNDFAAGAWRVSAAEPESESLRRAVRHLESLPIRE